MKFLTFIFVGMLGLAVQAAESDVSVVDRTIGKSRLVDAFGSFYVRPHTKWKVNWVGQTQEWTWTGKEWTCSEDGQFIPCSRWTPIFLSWANKRGWAEELEFLDSKGFDIEKPRLTSVSPGLVVVMGVDSESEAPPTPVEEDESLKQLQSKRWADRLWEVKRGDEPSTVIGVSLLSQLLDRINRGNRTEWLEWSRDPKTRALKLTRFVIQEGPEIASFTLMP